MIENNRGSLLSTLKLLYVIIGIFLKKATFSPIQLWYYILTKKKVSFVLNDDFKRCQCSLSLFGKYFIFKNTIILLEFSFIISLGTQEKTSHKSLIMADRKIFLEHIHSGNLPGTYITYRHSMFLKFIDGFKYY